MKPISRSLLCLMVLFGATTAARAGQVSTQWVAQAGFPGTPSKVVTDAAGNVYVTGSTYSADQNWDTSPADMLTAKYDANGVKQWEVVYNGVGNGLDRGNDIVVDNLGYVYVTGGSWGTPIYGQHWNMVTFKYAPDGAVVWEQRYDENTPFGSEGSAIALDDSGNVYVAANTIYDTYDGGPSHVWYSGSDIMMVKYSAAGARLWKFWFDGTNAGDDGVAPSIVVTQDSVYMAATIDGDDHGWGVNQRNIGVFKLAVVDGTLAWVSRYDGGGADHAARFAVDPSGNVYVTGSSDRLLSGYSQWDTYLWDYVTVKFDANGVQQWASRYDGTRIGNNSPSFLALDANNDVYVTGTSAGAGSGMDIATVKYRGADGAQLWVDRFAGTATGDDSGANIQVDADGNVFVAGTTVNTGTGQDMTIIRYDAAGNRRWAEFYNGDANGNDVLSAIALDDRGDLLLAGSSADASGTPRFTSVKFQMDLVAPAITLTTPAAGAEYLLRQVVNAAFSASDAKSGLAPGSPSGTVPNGAPINTATVGTKTFTVNAADVAGNAAPPTVVTYEVRYGWRGFTNSKTAEKIGNTIPIKFSLYDAAGALVTTATPTLTTVSPTGVSKDMGAIRFDALAQQYVYQLKTTGFAAGAWTFKVILGDGTTKTLQYTLTVK